MKRDLANSKVVADNMQDGKNLTKANLSGKLGEAYERNHENLAWQRKFMFQQFGPQ